MGKHQRKYLVWVYKSKTDKTSAQVTTILANGNEDAEKKAVNFCRAIGYNFHKVVEVEKVPMI